MSLVVGSSPVITSDEPAVKRKRKKGAVLVRCVFLRQLAREEDREEGSNFLCVYACVVH